VCLWCLCVYIYVCMYVYIYIYMHKYIHTHTHTRTHTQTIHMYMLMSTGISVSPFKARVTAPSHDDVCVQKVQALLSHTNIFCPCNCHTLSSCALMVAFWLISLADSSKFPAVVTTASASRPSFLASISSFLLSTTRSSVDHRHLSANDNAVLDEGFNTSV
jgi:hypothetical protein